MKNTQATALYIHWPFCKAKCPYCDFNSHVRENIDEEAWRRAYVKSLERYAELLPGRTITSIFFGGGTPSLMSPATVQAVVEAADRLWGFAPGVEITLEANPTSVEADKFRGFRQAGINRVSLGVQAFDDQALKFLGREHSLVEAIHALEIAGDHFERYSFDLIYARPGQDLTGWERELGEALKLARGHLSLYQLTIERSTPFYIAHAQGRFSMPGEDLAADFFNLTQEITARAGLPGYEVSNHAVPGQESLHNLSYWHYDDYIGVGPGAHGRLVLDGQKFATREHSAPEVWLERAGADGNGAHPFKPLAPPERFLEALMMGLRLNEGVALARLEEEAGRPWAEMIDPTAIGTLVEQGWAVIEGGRMRLEREGVLRLNAVVPYILNAT